MLPVEEIYDLVEARRKELGLSQARISELITGKSGDTSLIQNLRRGKIPRADKLAELSKVLGLEFYFGPAREKSEMMRAAFGPLGDLKPSEQKKVIENAVLALTASKTDSKSELEPSGLIYLPEYNIRASAGSGASVSSEMIVRDVGFHERFLRDLGATPNQCSIIRAVGDSMYPTIPEGALLVIDHSQIGIDHGGIFVLGIGEALLVKRMRRRIDGDIDLISDNAHYAPETLSSDGISDLRVIGRVVYFCRAP